jgi:hypothetical protein
MNKHQAKKPIQTQRCDLCGAEGLHTEFLTELHGEVLIQGIPKHHCDVCHESYFTHQTLESISAIRAEPHRYTQPLRVLAASMG